MCLLKRSSKTSKQVSRVLSKSWNRSMHNKATFLWMNC
jgi:hypothetical protein